jgi:Tfp pilus assembly protein PilF
LKVGEPVLARDQFAEAVRLDPADTTVVLEYGFLCYATQKPAEARRVFHRLRATNATAEAAFQHMDEPLATGMAHWQAAIASRGGHLLHALRIGHAVGTARRVGSGGGAL